MSVPILYVVRHAEAAWSAGADHDRPLADAGREAAARAGAFLRGAGDLPELVLTSSAARAVETTERLAAAAGIAGPVEAHRELYDTDVPTVLEMLRRRTGSRRRVLLVNHEPTCSALVAALAGGARVAFSTATLARIDIADEWSTLRRDTGTLRWLVTARALAALATPR